jgi:hypothetical protein
LNEKILSLQVLSVKWKVLSVKWKVLESNGYIRKKFLEAQFSKEHTVASDDYLFLGIYHGFLWGAYDPSSLSSRTSARIKHSTNRKL